MTMGPSLNGIGVGVSVGVIVGVKVSVGVSVIVAVWVGDGVNVVVDVSVRVGVWVSVREAVALMKKAWTEGFDVNNQAVRMKIPTSKLITQKPITNRLSDFDEVLAIIWPPEYCGVVHPMPY
jgi:hypothetical protein